MSNRDGDFERAALDEREASLRAVRKRRQVRGLLSGGAVLAVFVPLRFYLEFGEVGTMGWGTTVFLCAISWLAALGIEFSDRPAFHAPVAVSGGIRDAVGAFWLVACAFGPLAGWALTELPLTERSWRWQFGARIALAGVAPIAAALCLTPYARGLAARIAIPLLLLVTAIPVATTWWPVRDLVDGPTRVRCRVVWTDGGRFVEGLDGQTIDVPFEPGELGRAGQIVTVTFLPHTFRPISVEK